MTRNPGNRRGFTLIELIAVIVVLAILVGVALPKYFDYAAEARVAATKGTLGGVRAGVANYFANQSINGSAAYPVLADLNAVGNVMQEAIPANPYDNTATVFTATLIEANARTPTSAGADGGWAYYTDGTATAIFYANSNTVGENAY